MKNLKSFFKNLFKVDESRFITASDAQSLCHFSSVLDRQSMLNKFLKNIYKDIEQSALMNKTYTVIEIPVWLTMDEFQFIVDDFKSKGYDTDIIEHLNLIIISWL